jgi:hypothetical protein
LKKQAQKHEWTACPLRKCFDAENPQWAGLLARVTIAIFRPVFRLHRMGHFYERLVRRALFSLDSERAHELGVQVPARRRAGKVQIRRG